MNCRDAERLLDTFFDGELDGRLMRDAALHITRCPSCEAELQERERTHDALTASVAAEVGDLADGEIWSRIEDRLDERGPARILPFRRNSTAADDDVAGVDDESPWLEPAGTRAASSSVSIPGLVALAASVALAIFLMGQDEEQGAGRIATAPESGPTVNRLADGRAVNRLADGRAVNRLGDGRAENRLGDGRAENRFGDGRAENRLGDVEPQPARSEMTRVAAENTAGNADESTRLAADDGTRRRASRSLAVAGVGSSRATGVGPSRTIGGNGFVRASSGSAGRGFRGATVPGMGAVASRRNGQVRIESLNARSGAMAIWSEPGADSTVIWIGEGSPRGAVSSRR